ncbi:MAG: prolipoprotein diacylglyceryl transferase [Clostridia bacterium]|nr:prolipoprotein diacylglyceryl transferase [Clostridia bacterium]
MYPVLFHLGSLEIRSWGLMVALGIISGTWLAYREAQRRGMKADLVLDFVIWAVVAGFLGARLWEVAFTWGNYAANPLEALYFWKGGLSIQGGILGGVVAGVIFVRKHKLNLWQFADSLAPGIILGQALGRFGCFLNGDAYGMPTDSPLGVAYVPGTPAYEAFGAQPLFPAELFEAGWNLVILGLLLVLRRKKPVDGALFLLYAILYSVGRFTLEFWRGDSLHILAQFKTAQVASLATVIVAAAFLVWRWLNRDKRLGNIIK